MEENSSIWVEVSQDLGSLRMEIVSPEVFLQSIVGCVTGGLVLVVGGEGQVKARGSCS